MTTMVWDDYFFGAYCSKTCCGMRVEKSFGVA